MMDDKEKREKARDWWLKYCQGTLSESDQKSLEEVLSSVPDLREELQEFDELLSKLESIEIPEPSSEMDLKFQAMLAEHRDSLPKVRTSWVDLVIHWISPRWRVAFPSMALGFLIAWLVYPRESGKEMARMSEDLAEMKKMMILTMIEQPKAQDRIAAVSMVSDVKLGDEKIISVLINTLNTDKSMNVRLAALDALIPYGRYPEVRKSLIESISLQESPLLQVALADAMVQLKTKESVGAFQNLMDSSNLEETVKSKLQSTIKLLKEI